jgi:hypothetical protein
MLPDKGGRLVAEKRCSLVQKDEMPLLIENIDNVRQRRKKMLNLSSSHFQKRPGSRVIHDLIVEKARYSVNMQPVCKRDS